MLKKRQLAYRQSYHLPHEDHTLPGAPKTVVSNAHCRSNGSSCTYSYSKAHGFSIIPPADGFINSRCSQSKLPSGALRQLSTAPFLPGSLALPCGLNRDHHTSFPLKWVSFSKQPGLVFQTAILQIAGVTTVNIQRHRQQQHIVPSLTSSSGSIFQTDDTKEASM